MAGESLQGSGKPSRSEELVTEEERQTISEQVKEHFEALAPKRPHKPTRSEPGGTPPENAASWRQEPSDIPEYLRLQDLHASSEVYQNRFPLPLPSFQGDAVDGDYYPENEYYKDMISVANTEHHTTGSGFIKVENGVTTFHLEEEGESRKAICGSCKCNPATNDWIPSSNQVVQSSQKPPRSDPTN